MGRCEHWRYAQGSAGQEDVYEGLPHCTPGQGKPSPALRHTSYMYRAPLSFPLPARSSSPSPLPEMLIVVLFSSFSFVPEVRLSKKMLY